jgi:hypothetical protein
MVDPDIPEIQLPLLLQELQVCLGTAMQNDQLNHT